ncbi:MAG: hypothetical protein KJ990_07715 [Proteobacteria bacterium]|nr:hypothetical protein [Pseudomonadota bacterium]MBU1650395.1 hypothetical protein [Pseudomonadota bacterium]MBU1985703.1 hypothetical protein [Pseudomonadota bacterium]
MNIKYAITVSTKLLLSVFLVFVSSYATAEGLDEPHNAVNSISCDKCHDVFAYDQPKLMPPWTVHAPQNIDDTQLNSLCWSCHNDIPVPYVKTHSSLQTGTEYGNWTVECSVCHDPHVQEQNNLNGSTYGKLIRKQISLDRITGAIPQKSGSKTVKLLGQTGAKSFADGDAVYDGVCEVCHTKTSHHRNDGTGTEQSHYNGFRCTSCHSHVNGFDGFDHAVAAVKPEDPIPAENNCTNTGGCHGTPGLAWGSSGPDWIAGVHGSQCGRCHVDPLGGGSIVADPPDMHIPPGGGSCSDCHGIFTTVHSHYDHNAASQSGKVAVFPPHGHDDAEDNIFEVQVDCTTCHAMDLKKAHGNDCTTCHRTPYNTLPKSTPFWNRTCQQGGCHTVFHAGLTTAHDPFSDPYDPDLSCSLCHIIEGDTPLQAKCLNCHATVGNLAVPITSSNAQASYSGAAQIVFSITVGGKVGVGRTFYKLDGAAVTGGSQVVVSAAGSHTLEFWSISQGGILESSHKNTSFTITADITPPATTSNAQAAYYQNALITLTATDASDLGVKNTYYTLNGGPTQTGTTISIPETIGTIAYTLLFWSEDWSGNIEPQHSVSFTVTGGSGTLRLVWENSDTNGSPCIVDSKSRAWWTISRLNAGGGVEAILATGNSGGFPGTCPGWSGVNDVSVHVNLTKHYRVSIDWETTDDGGTEVFQFDVHTNGEVILQRY